MTHRLCLITCLCLLLQPSCTSAATVKNYRDARDAQAMNDVLIQIQAKDCAAAVQALNKGLADQQPGVIMLAGTMYEQGQCLKPDWERAAHFYQRAYEAGNNAALPRLISGYAEKNRDPGAALWWQTKQGYPLPAECGSANQLVGDPEAFVAALNAWPKERLAACVYTAGVTQRILGDIQYQDGSRGYEQPGITIMRFVPATGTITWTSERTGRIKVSQTEPATRDPRSLPDDVFLKRMHAIGERTLHQFAKPNNIDPAWKVDVKILFTYE